MAIDPDTKDWTWVLETRCPDCGFAAAEVDFDDIPRLVRRNAARWIPVLHRADVAVRPNDHTWSALEYAAHVRDVFRIFEARLRMMVTEVDPAFPNWDQDATAVADRYDQQEPAVVARELTEAAASVADAFAHVAVGDLGRTGRRSDGAVFTVATLGRYFLHDPVHHLHDVAGD